MEYLVYTSAYSHAFIYSVKNAFQHHLAGGLTCSTIQNIREKLELGEF